MQGTQPSMNITLVRTLGLQKLGSKVHLCIGSLFSILMNDLCPHSSSGRLACSTNNCWIGNLLSQQVKSKGFIFLPCNKQGCINYRSGWWLSPFSISSFSGRGYNSWSTSGARGGTIKMAPNTFWLYCLGKSDLINGPILACDIKLWDIAQQSVCSDCGGHVGDMWRE